MAISDRRGAGLAVILLLLAPGCSKAPPPARESIPRPAPEAPKTVRLHAVPIQTPDKTLASSIPRFTFLTEDRHSELIFVDISSGELQVHPGLFIVRKGRTELIELDDERFTQHGWIEGYISYDRRHIWAITDTVVESPSWDLNIIHSADGGATWGVAATLHKPYYLAEFHSLQMGPDGSGELRILHEDDLTDSVSHVPAGYYIYTTRDWGDSWSPPTYLPNTIQKPDAILSRSRAEEQTLSAYLRDSLRKTDADVPPPPKPVDSHHLPGRSLPGEDSH